MFIEPDFKVIRMEVADVIMTSGGSISGDDQFGGADEE